MNDSSLQVVYVLMLVISKSSGHMNDCSLEVVCVLLLVILKMLCRLLVRFLQQQLNLLPSLCMESVNLQLYEILNSS